MWDLPKHYGGGPALQRKLVDGRMAWIRDRSGNWIGFRREDPKPLPWDFTGQDRGARPSMWVSKYGTAFPNLEAAQDWVLSLELEDSQLKQELLGMHHQVIVEYLANLILNRASERELRDYFRSAQLEWLKECSLEELQELQERFCSTN